MKKNILFIIRSAIFPAIISLIAAMSAQAQLSTKGTDFWFGFSENFTPTLKVFVTADEATTGTISIPLGTFTQNFTVAANSSVSYIIPLAEAYNTGSETIRPMGIHITTQKPVSVYALNFRDASSDASGVLPTPALGVNYRVAGARADEINYIRSQFLIIATQNNTTVTITPSVTTSGGHVANTPFNVTLNRGQTYQVQSSAGNAHLNGTLVTSSAPVAVFSGAICTTIGNCTACDHIFEQNMPTNRLGQRFVIVPLALRRAAIVYDAVATENTTQVFRNGILSATINAGETYNFSSTSREVITTSAPVALMQYSPGSSCDGVTSDPFSVYVPPVDQMIDKITFEAFVTPNIPSYFMNIVTATPNTGNVRLDGQPVNGFTPIPGDPTLSAVILSGIPGGTHNLFAGTGGQLSAMIYGYGSYDSYGYLAGTSALALRGSDIIATPGFEYWQNIRYVDYQSDDITQWNSAPVMGLTVRDGGTTSPDADALPTILTDLTIQINRPGMVRRLALYRGEAKLADLPVPENGAVNFSGLNVVAPDNATAQLTLRATFTTTVTDNTQLTFTVISATAGSGGTEFKDLNGGGAVSSVSGDDNRLEVVADRLRFIQQPTDVQVGAIMQPDVIVRAEDEFQNADFDLENTELSLYNDFMSGNPEQALLSQEGTAVFGTLSFTQPASNQILFAEIYFGEGGLYGESTEFDILGGEGDPYAPIMHLIASDIGQANNSLVQLWPDAVDAGSDDHATQNTSSMRPTYCNSGACLINNQPVVQFANNKGMGFAARDPLTGGGEKTIFLVFRTGSNASTKQMLIELGGESAGFNMYIDNLRLYAGAWDSTRWWINRIIGTNRVYLAQFVFNGSSMRLSVSNEGVTSVTSTNNNLYLDPFITANLHNGGVGATYDQTRYHNGVNLNSGFSDFFMGRMAEAYVFNTTNVNVRTQIFDYLNQKYGIQAGAQPFTKDNDYEQVDISVVESGLAVAPNPTSGRLNIFYRLDSEVKYRLTLQDMLGQTVSVIEEGNSSAGNYQVEFDASRLSSGMYRATLTTSTGTVTVPVVIAR